MTTILSFYTYIYIYIGGLKEVSISVNGNEKNPILETEP